MVLSGDGLIGVVADVLRAFPGAVLGVLPGGRGNDLARVLGIPQDPIAACAAIAHGVHRAMDLGEVAAASEAAGQPLAPGHPGTGQAGIRGRAFVGIASVGFDSVANRIANEAPARLGNLVYAYGALRALVSWRPARFEIELDPPGERFSFTAYTVGACNSKTYGGGMRAAPDAMLDDGLLEVVVLERVSKLAFLTKLLPRVFKGTHVQLPSVHVFRAAEGRDFCRPALHDVRRRRSDRGAAATGPRPARRRHRARSRRREHAGFGLLLLPAPRSRAR